MVLRLLGQFWWREYFSNLRGVRHNYFQLPSETYKNQENKYCKDISNFRT